MSWQNAKFGFNAARADNPAKFMYHSFVGLIRPDGVMEYTNCYGTPNNLEFEGNLLYHYYNSPELVTKLISQGEIKQLGITIPDSPGEILKYGATAFYQKKRKNVLTFSDSLQAKQTAETNQKPLYFFNNEWYVHHKDPNNSNWVTAALNEDNVGYRTTEKQTSKDEAVGLLLGYVKKHGIDTLFEKHIEANDSLEKAIYQVIGQMYESEVWSKARDLDDLNKWCNNYTSESKDYLLNFKDRIGPQMVSNG